MPTRLETLLGRCAIACGQLRRALTKPKDEFTRDSSIHRFEFTFELFWKMLQEYCALHGFETNSPRTSIREAFRIGVISDEPVYLEMLGARNKTSHLYSEALSEDIYAALSGFATAMEAAVDAVRRDLSLSD